MSKKKENVDILSPDDNLSSQKKRNKMDDPRVKTTIFTALGSGASFELAAGLAGVTRKTIYNWKDKNPEEYKIELEKASQAPLTLARMALISLLRSRDPATIRWFLERRDPAFAPKKETGDYSDISTEALRERVQDGINQLQNIEGISDVRESE